VRVIREVQKLLKPPPREPQSIEVARQIDEALYDMQRYRIERKAAVATIRKEAEKESNGNGK
jgi:hypothetical protein